MELEGIEIVRDYEESTVQSALKVTHRTGIVNTHERDYSIIKKVEKINGDSRNLARKRSMSRTRTRSRSRQPTDRKEWETRDTKDSTIGGVAKKNRLPAMPTGGTRSENQDRSDANTVERRGRSSSRVKSAIKGVQNVFGREQSASRGAGSVRGRSRSSSRVRSALKGAKNVFGNPKPLSDKSYESTEGSRPSRGRSPSRRDDLPPKPTKKAEEKAPEPEPELEPEPEQKTSEIDFFKDHDIMQLDDRNTVMHVACLLHHTTSDIIDRLEEDPSLAFEMNNANELPLHYAAMDKKGVNHDVLKKLLRTNPEGVKQRNVQNSLPVHLACMVGAPSQYTLKTFLKMYPKSVMIQSDFPLLFEKEMLEKIDDEDSYNSDDDDFVAYRPTANVKPSGIASFFACAGPSQVELELYQESQKKKQENSNEFAGNEDFDETPQIETGFSPLHLAVINSANPSAIQSIVNTNPKCVHLKSSQGRTALDCAQFIVKQHWLYGTDDEGAVKNTFASIEILEEAAINEKGE
jgi:ankyrin repeat protein